MRLAVTIPIGPEKYHLKYLEECFMSVYAQTRMPDEIIIVDDMAHPEWKEIFFPIAEKHQEVRIVLVQNPWRLGVGGSFNVGISYSSGDLTFMLGGDDKLLPTCLQRVEIAYLADKDPIGYYWTDVIYDNNEIQGLPCNAAAVSRDLWQFTGGFAPETGCGAPDAALISIMLANPGAGHLIRVGGGPQYFVRRHIEQDTAFRGPYQGAILQVRNALTNTWRPTSWGRYG